MIDWYRGASEPAPNSTRQHMGARVVSGPEGVCGYQISVAVSCYRRGLEGQPRESAPSFGCEIAVESRIRPMRSLREALGRRHGMEAGGDASQPTTVRGFLAITACAFLGLAPVSALDGSAECFTICTSRRARRLNFARWLP